MPPSLRASLDALLAVQVERVQAETAAAEAKLRAEEEHGRHRALQLVQQEEQRLRALAAIEQAELLRRASEEERVRAAAANLLTQARQSMARRAALSCDRRQADHQRVLREVSGDHVKRRLKTALAGALLAAATLTAVVATSWARVEQQLDRDVAALVGATTQTQVEARQEVQRLQHQLATTEQAASLETSALEAELAAAKMTLAKLEAKDAGPAHSPTTAPAPRRLAQTASSTKKAANSVVAVATQAEPACDAYDPMCFSL